jgi:hypothetical protein
MDHFLPVNGQTSQSIERMSSLCYYQEKWLKQIAVTLVIQQSEAPKITVAQARRKQKKTLQVGMKQSMVDWNHFDVYERNLDTVTMNTNFFSSLRL